MLYRGNTFSFLDAASLIYFSQRILPQRLELIKRIHILWSYDPRYHVKDADKKDLVKMNGVLKKMHGLRHLDFITFFKWPQEAVDILSEGVVGWNAE